MFGQPEIWPEDIYKKLTSISFTRTIQPAAKNFLDSTIYETCEGNTVIDMDLRLGASTLGHNNKVWNERFE